MSLFGFVKDVVMLPVDVALDVTMITPMVRSVTDSKHDQPFGTLSRLESLVKNVDDTLD
jgi:hypothetical protein